MLSAIPAVDVGGRLVGDDHPVVFMAEAGTFFNKDMDLAREYLRQAVEGGAQVFKTEVLHDPDVCLAGTGLDHRYSHATGVSVEDYRALIERKTVSLSDYEKLFESVRSYGVPFVASVYDLKGIDFLVEQGSAAVKIARNNINNVPLIRHAARSGLPVFFDAGEVYLDELAAAVRQARAEGAGGVIVNLHPGANPAPPERHNLRVVHTYKASFGTPVGLACHYRGDEILYAAVGAGVNILEKGVDVDPDRVEQDLVSALPLRALAETVRKVEACSRAMGRPHPEVSTDRDLSTRAGLVARSDIGEGAVFGHENLGFAWPPLGIPVDQWDLVVGQRARRGLKRNSVITWSDVDFAS